MNTEKWADAWAPFGQALRDYFAGDVSAAVITRSDLGEESVDAMAAFFREPDDFFEFDRVALELCRGRVLDVGAGTGVHALELVRRGFDVLAIDRVPEAVEIMVARGVPRVRRADLFELDEGPFDTILMLMNGLGITETLKRLDSFLRDAPRLLAPGGQVLADSTDVRSESELPDRGPDEPRREDGRYIGEIQFQMQYAGMKGAPFPQLYVDPETLAHHAARAGWRCEIVLREAHGHYLARLATLRTPEGQLP